MRIVTYARVSTIQQETQGQSLVNQEAAFQSFLRRTSNSRIAAYAESKSAKSVSGRREFLRLIEGLPRLKPDLIVVDTIDRFSRNLQDGLNLLERFRGHGIRLLPLDWDEPIDLDDDRDWKTVVQELTAADYERRRIRARTNRSIQARRDRGATLHSKAPFGLQRAGDALVPDPLRAPLIHKIDRMFIGGKSQRKIVQLVQSILGTKAWQSKAGLINCLQNTEVVKAGLRTPSTQKRINERFEAARRRYGLPHRFAHPMSGVFACGFCVDCGANPDDALLIGRFGCTIGCNARLRVHRNIITMREASLESILVHIMQSVVSDDDLHSHFRAVPLEPGSQEVEELIGRIMTCDASTLSYRKEQAKLITAIPETSALSVLIKQQLLQALKKERRVAEMRGTILDELARFAAGVPGLDDNGRYVSLLAYELMQWPSMNERRKNTIAKAFCARFGSRPVAYNGGRTSPQAIVTWYEVFPEVVWRIRHRKGGSRAIDVLPRVGVPDSSEQLQNEPLLL